ncbi:MAG: DUF3108 domain-containing protein [Rhodocyclaceae bacterium]|nr:DUF3108 domain-containing protein [Rhodocyclaceae bacterium]
MRRISLEKSLVASVLVALIAVLPAPTSRAAKLKEAGAKPAATEKPVSRQGTVRYYVRRGDDPMVLAHIDYEWRHDGKSYELRSVFETVGMLAALKPTRTAMASQGEVSAEGLRPLSFRNEKKKRTDTAEFDWNAKTVSYRDEKAALLAGTQDLLSLYAQLAWLVPREALDISVATGSKVEAYRITAQGEEKLTVAKKQIAAVHVSAQTDDERIDFWLPTLANVSSGKRSFPADMPLPLRVRVTEKSGITLVQSLEPPAQGR